MSTLSMNDTRHVWRSYDDLSSLGFFALEQICYGRYMTGIVLRTFHKRAEAGKILECTE